MGGSVAVAPSNDGSIGGLEVAAPHLCGGFDVFHRTLATKTLVTWVELAVCHVVEG